MEEEKKGLLGAIFIFLLLVGIFILSSFISQIYFDEIKNLIGGKIIGKIIYVFLLIFAVVIAPIGVAPLTPIASSQWGWQLVFALTLFGETLGATLAFFIARKYGYPLVKKFVSLKKIHKYEELVPEKNVFIGIVVIKMAIPFDIVNYAIGIFSKIGWRKFMIATAIGFTPYSFIISYLGALPFIYVMLITMTGILLFILIILAGLYSEKDFRRMLKKWWDKRFKEN